MASVSLRHQLGAAHLAASMSGASAVVPCECVRYVTQASSIFWTAAGHCRTDATPLDRAKKQQPLRTPERLLPTKRTGPTE